MKSLNVEILMGHDIGLANSYYKPPQQELLGDYLQIYIKLNLNLKKQINELRDRNKRRILFED